MIKSYTQQELEEKFKQLPAGIEEVIFGVNAEKTLEEIGKKYKLQIDQLGILSNETHLVMLGLTHPKDFINNLAERLELDKEIAKNIAQEINQRIFYEIREELKKMHSIGETVDSKLNVKPTEKIKIPATPFEYKLKSEKTIRAPLNPARNRESLTSAFAKTSSDKPAEPQKSQTTQIPDEVEEIKNPPDKKYPTGDPYREPLE